MFNSQFVTVRLLLAISLFHSVIPLEPKPKVKGSGETITVEAGSALQLECEVENTPRRLKVKWERCKSFNTAGACTSYSGLSSRNKVKYNRDYGIRKEGVGTYILYIYNIQPSQSGTYFCSVKTSLIAARTQDYIRVVVYQRPMIESLYTTPDVVAWHGEPVRLDCSAFGSPEPLVMWERAGRTVLPGGGYSRMNKSLEISSCDLRSRGTYICSASNSYGKTLHTITVDCLGSPSVTPAQYIVQQRVGYQIKLVCTVESSPALLRVWWTRNGEIIQPDNNRYKVGTMQAALGRVLTKLVLVKGVVYSDYSDIYSCFGENSYGTVNASIRLTEAERPQLMEGRLLSASSSPYTSCSYMQLFCVTILFLIAS